MSLRQASALGKKIAGIMMRIFLTSAKDLDRQAMVRIVSRELSECGYNFRYQENFFIENPTGAKKRPRFVIIDYVIEDLVILLITFNEEEDPLEWRALLSYMKISRTRAAVRVNFSASDVEKAILYWDTSMHRDNL